jgi:hypothetical protein
MARTKQGGSRMGRRFSLTATRASISGINSGGGCSTTDAGDIAIGLGPNTAIAIGNPGPNSAAFMGKVVPNVGTTALTSR